MAKSYKIIHVADANDAFNDVKAQLAEIGITMGSVSNQNAAYIEFSDGTRKQFSYTSNPTSFFKNRWIFADDSTHFFIATKLTDTGNTFTSTAVHSENLCTAIIIEKSDGSVISNGGNEGTTESVDVFEQLSTGLLATDLHHDVSLTELMLLPLTGSFVNYSGASRAELYRKNKFKYAYVNFQRWFQFGTIIVDSDGNEYFGYGWLLFRINV